MDNVCRLTCRHTFHAACWASYIAHSADQEHVSCPNCRDPGRMIASWPYIDHALVTQEDPQGTGGQVPNLLESEDDTLPDEYASGGSQEADAADEPSELFFTEGSPGYHIRTQLADGRPSLIIDPGSVGNL